MALQIGFLNFPDATTFADQFDGQLMQAHQVDIDQAQAQGNI